MDLMLWGAIAVYSFQWVSVYHLCKQRIQGKQIENKKI